MKLKVAGITITPVKIGMKSHTRLMKKPSGSPYTAARTSVPTYMPTRSGMWRTRAATISSPSSDSAFALGSSRCSTPPWAATSSLNIAWRITLEAPSIVFSMKLPFLRRPMQPHGQSAISPCVSHAGVDVAIRDGSPALLMQSAFRPHPARS